MKKELADYLNKEAKKTKAKQPVRMSSIPSKDVFALRDIVDVILGDDALRKQFRICAGVSTAEMKRACRSLNKAYNAYLDDDIGKFVPFTPEEMARDAKLAKDLEVYLGELK